MKSGKLKHWQVIAILLAVYDALTVSIGYLAVLWLRFDCNVSAIPYNYLLACLKFSPIYVCIVLVVYYALKLYRSIWRFASYDELLRTIAAVLITWAIHVAGITLFFSRMPITYYVFGGLLQFLFATGIRFSYRLVLLLRANKEKLTPYTNSKRVMIVGAGAAAEMLLRDMRRARELNDIPVCIIDDNSNKWNRFVEGIKVVGGRNDIPMMVEQYKVNKIYIAIPSASAKDYKEIIDICQQTECEIKSLPGLYQLANGEVTVGQMKDVDVIDLLGRNPIKVNMDEIFDYLKGKVILVTGGGGSIGSELCRQIAAHEPKQLIIFDIYENNAYDIQLELKQKYPELNLETIIGSVRDSRMVFKLFDTYRPQIVYHAAAHKHVPLMEDSPCEAIKNNTMGTYKTAFAAMVHGCERFVLISTDKAVNPTNIMGASKRLCEMVVQSFDNKIKEGKAVEIPQLFTHEVKSIINTERVNEALRNTKTEFVAVRFGNVLGSNGSVIPLFKKQIAQGGPVTVTHPDIIRYFMTIPEAVSLVLQAGTYAQGGEIFVLDMGAPVKIDTLARNLIRLSGHKPDVDIKIVYSGLRPGEKLFEEKLMAEEGLKKTDNELIHIGCPIAFDTDEFLGQLDELLEAAYKNTEDIRDLVQKVVKTYHPADI